MTKCRITAAAGAAVAVVLITGTALAGVATGGTAVPFIASYSGKAVVRVSGSIADISADATGTGVPVGKSTLSGRGRGTNVEPCPLFGGPGTITASGGLRLNFVITPTAGSACTDEEGQTFSLLGRATFTGGTGKYATARGSFKFTGAYDRKSGLFSVKFVGTLTTATTLTISADRTNKLRFTKKALSAPAGKIMIVMTNPSILPHNIAIRNGTTASSKVIAKSKVVGKGGISKVTVTLKKGKYRFVCTVPGHEAGGMWGILTVT